MSEPGSDRKGRLSRWRAERRLRRFHAKCDRLRIPYDVRQRMLKVTDRAPDWYARRQMP